MMKGVPGALLRYRIMAYVVGCLLIVLMCVAVPLKYFADDDRLVTVTGIMHGWLYMILLISAFDLSRRVRWPWWRLVVIALAGTVPFLSFVAERYATRDARAWLDRRAARSAARASAPASDPAPDPVHDPSS